MIIRYATIILAAVFLAATAAVGVSAMKPEEAGAADTVTVKTCTGGTIGLTTDEKRMLDLHNETRADNDLPPFCVHPTLTKAARAHSREMIDKDYFSHNSFNGEAFSARLKQFGYGYRTAGENIAWGSGTEGTPVNIFEVDDPRIAGPDSWMNSPGHKANILNKNFREIGIGVYKGTYKGIDNVTGGTAAFGPRR